MSTSSPTIETALATNVKVTADTLTVELQDGRAVSVPVAWYPRLADGTLTERRRWELIGPGIGIHWPSLDEDISVEALLLGLASNETAASLQRWRTARRRPANRDLQPTAARRKHSRRRG